MKNKKVELKDLNVVVAVICDSLENKSKIFATKKGYGKFKSKWEFPGGKIEPKETPQEALKREIKEELDVEIEIGDLVSKIEYNYEDFSLVLRCFWCEILSGEIKLLEAMDSRWLTKENLFEVDWLSANLEIIRKIEKNL